MIENERIADYIDSLCTENAEITELIRKESVSADMPIIRRDGEQLLKTLLALKEPESILEIGTCSGYSAIVMAENSNADITTLEIGRKDWLIAQANIERAGYMSQINCINIDAADYLKNCEERFDFIFMDAAKGQYIKWLGDITRILKKGGVLLSDNVLHYGDVAESRFAVERRDRTTHARMREYLFELTHSKEYQTAVMNVADGMSVSIRL